ncbi:MAG: metal-sensing transcriptional repressor [bacterium]|nr:metal-sensing transcriptional repressor [bacterium]
MTPQKTKALINFKKTKSLMEKIIQMVETDEYCVNVMQQNLAAIGLLRSAHEMLMEGHLNSCFKMAFETKNSLKQKQMTNEILKVTKLFNK